MSVSSDRPAQEKYIPALHQSVRKPTSGEVLYKEENICDSKADIRKFREEVGMVFQRFNLFPLKTVLGNVTMAPVLTKHRNKAEAKEIGMELLKKLVLRARHM